MSAMAMWSAATSSQPRAQTRSAEFPISIATFTATPPSKRRR